MPLSAHIFRPFAVVLSIVFVSISLVVAGCQNRSDVSADISDRASAQPGSGNIPTVKDSILEIWKDTDGSVPIRGRYLFIRLDSSGMYEFDYVVRTDIGSPKRRIDFSLHRTRPAQLSEDKGREVSLLMARLSEDRALKDEYSTVGLTLDTIDKLTIQIRGEGGAERTITLNNSERYVIDPTFSSVIPASVSDLVRSIHELRYDSICHQYPPSDPPREC